MNDDILQVAPSKSKLARFTSATSIGDYHTMPRVVTIVSDWFKKYLYFSRATICIQGLVFGHSFANHAVVTILITYLTELWKHPHTQMAVVVINIQDGVQETMVIVLSLIPRTHMGLFRVIATTNASYIMGLFLLWFSAKKMSVYTASRVFYGAMVLITLGEAGRLAALQEFLDEQYFSERNHAELTYDENQDKKDGLWILPWFLGAVGAVGAVIPAKNWAQILLISTITMGVSYLVFLLGFPRYFTYNMINSEQGQDARLEEVNHREQEPRVPTQTRLGNVLRLINILKRDERFLKETLAIWLVFLLAYSVVMAAGNTFFYQQLDTLVDDDSNPAVIFSVLASFSKYLISFLWNLIPRKRKPSRLRIWCGMACIVLCCFVASQVESHRLNTTNTSIFWLVPQFFLLGAMEGLARYGMIDFLVDRVSEGDKVIVACYGSHTTDFFTGIGKILVGLSVLAFRGSWFDENSLDASHLDKYYRGLTISTSVVIFFHCCIAFHYMEESHNEMPSELTTEMPSELTTEMVNQNQPQIDPSPHNPDNAFTETLDDRVGSSDLLGEFVGQ